MTRTTHATIGADTDWRGALGALITGALLAAAPGVACQQSGSVNWPHRVLVTNDNGIEDRATQALARALARVADTYLVASADDRSGYSNLLTVIGVPGIAVSGVDDDDSIGVGVRCEP